MSQNETTGLEIFESPQAPTVAMTVRDLIERLSALDPEAPVVFRTPHFGVFGGNQAYGITEVAAVTLDRREHLYEGGASEDDETGEAYAYEPYLQVWPAWTGVVLGSQS